MRKKIVKISIISFFLVLLLSILLPFGYNMLFIDIYEPELVKGGDKLLNQMLTETPDLPDSYFNDEQTISKNLEGAIERIDKREDCCDFTANHLIRFYLENEYRLTEKNKKEIQDCLTGLKYWLTDYDGRDDSMCFWSENHQILFAVTEYLTANEWPNVKFADGRLGSSSWFLLRFMAGSSRFCKNTSSTLAQAICWIGWRIA